MAETVAAIARIKVLYVHFVQLHKQIITWQWSEHSNYNATCTTLYGHSWVLTIKYDITCKQCCMVYLLIFKFHLHSSILVLWWCLPVAFTASRSFSHEGSESFCNQILSMARQRACTSVGWLTSIISRFALVMLSSNPMSLHFTAYSPINNRLKYNSLGLNSESKIIILYKHTYY